MPVAVAAIVKQIIEVVFPELLAVSFTNADGAGLAAGPARRRKKKKGSHVDPNTQEVDDAQPPGESPAE